MVQRLHQFCRWAGAEPAAFFSNATQMMRLFTGPITMALVLRYLTPEIQGYLRLLRRGGHAGLFGDGVFSKHPGFAAHEYANSALPTGKPWRVIRWQNRGSFRWGVWRLVIMPSRLLYFVRGRHRGAHFPGGFFLPVLIRELQGFAVFGSQIGQPSDPAAKFVYERLSPLSCQFKNYWRKIQSENVGVGPETDLNLR